MKDFCGSFEDRCTVSVHVVQSAEDMYTKELSPGERLPTNFMVERTVWKTGRSELKIKDTSGKVLSKSKEDLDDIKQHMNLQVDNPAVILHQSHAKEFLKSSDPRDFYKLFLQATRLGKLRQRYREAENIEEEIAKVVHQQEDEYESFKEKTLHPAEQAWAEMENVREIVAKIKTARYEQCSRFVLDQHANIESFEKDIAKALDNRQRVEAKLAEAKANKGADNQEIQALKDEVDFHQQRQKHSTDEYKKVEADLLRVQRAVAKKENDKKAALRDIAAFKKDIEAVRRCAQSQLAEAAKLRKKKHPDRPVSQKQDLESRIEEVTSKYDEVSEKRQHLDDEDKELGRRLNDLRQRFNGMDDQVRRHAQKLDRIANVDRGNPLARFGNGVPAIARAFQAAERMFPKGKAPIGPVGAFIRIKDPKWGLALVDATHGKRGGQAWLIHSEKDFDICRKILRDNKLNDNDANFRALNADDFDVRVGKTSEPTILDIIEIDHPDPDAKRYIRNYLVDAFALNELHLAETFEAAKKVVERPIEMVQLSNGVKHELRRVCYNLNNQKTAIERKQSHLKSGSLRSETVRDNSNPYSVDVTAEKNHVKQQLDAATAERDALKSQIDAAHASKDVSAKAVMAVMKELNFLENQRNNLEGQIKLDEETQAKWKEADRTEEDSEIAALEDLSSLQQEEDDFRRQIESRKSDVESICNALAQQVEDLKSIEERKSEAEERKRQIQNEVKQVEKKLSEKYDDISNKNHSIDACRSMMEKYQKKAEQALKDKKSAEEALKQFEDAIPTTYEWKGPMPTDRTAEEIAQEVQRLEKQKQKVQKHRDFNQVELRYQKSKEINKDWMRRFDDLEEIVQRIDALKSQTSKTINLVRKSNKKFTRDKFRACLRAKGFDGNILFDDRNETMDPIVRTQTNSGQREDDVHDSGTVSVKQLSGGERSYSTLCLLLGLKDAANYPFLALDEVDVFMDERNRRVALKVLTDVLLGHNNSQTIIISPLSLATVSPGPQVKITIMRPIDRNQQRLPFAAAGASQAETLPKED